MAGEGNVIRFSEKQALFQKGLTEVYHNSLKVLKSSYTDWLTETTRRVESRLSWRMPTP